MWMCSTDSQVFLHVIQHVLVLLHAVDLFQENLLNMLKSLSSVQSRSLTSQ